MQSMIVKRGVVEWQPQSDWIDISNVANNEINLLVGDFLTKLAFAVTVTGGYTVDWGDGNTQNFASAATATHTYTVGAGQECSLGYTTFKVRIYAQTPANNITAFAIKGSEIQQYSNSILWAKFGTTGLTTLASAFFYNTSPQTNSYYLECLELPSSLASCTSFYCMCYNCVSLQKVVMPTTFSTSQINFDSVFYYCHSIKSVSIVATLLDIATFNGIFQGCYSLRNVTLPNGIANCTTFTNMFQECRSLITLILPDIVGATNMTCNNMFYNLR